MKRWLTKLLPTMVIVAVLAMIMPAIPVRAEANWLGDYKYRQDVTISRATGAQTDYQMMLTVYKTTGSSSGGVLYLQNHAESWGGTVPNDLRFTQADGTTEIPYEIESSDANSALVYFLTPTIGTSATTFKAYYGKTGDTTTSSGANTFPDFYQAFDDINDFQGDTGSYNCAGGIVTGTGAGAWKRIYTNDTFGPNTFSRARIYQDATAGTYSTVDLLVLDHSDYFKWIWQTAEQRFISVADSGAPTDESLAEGSAGAWQIILTEWTSGNINFYIDDSESAKSPRTASVPSVDTMKPQLAIHTNTIKVDWWKIGKYVTPEPVWGSWGAEEGLYPRLTASDSTQIESTTSTLNGNITLTNNGTCANRGFVWDSVSRGDPGNTAPADSDYASYDTEAGAFGAGAYVGEATGLTPYDTYYYRACANNALGWGYSDEWEFEFYDHVKTAFISPVVGIQTEYPMMLKVHAGAGTDDAENVYLDNYGQADFDDLKFTNSDGDVMPYLRESYISGISAIVLVGIDSIAADPDDTLVYFYYGNPDVGTKSDGDATGLFYDDFDDLDAWSGDLGSFNAAGGIVTATETGGGWDLIYTADDFEDDVFMRARMKYDSTTSHSGVRLQDDVVQTQAIITGWHATPEFTGMAYIRDDVGVDNVQSEPMPEVAVATWQVHRFDWHSDKVRFYINDSEVANSPLTDDVPDAVDMTPMLGVFSYDGFEVDWIFVGKRVDPSPVWGSWGGVPGAPSVTTVAADGIAASVSALNADITNIGDSDVIIRGFKHGRGYTESTFVVIPDTQRYIRDGDYVEIFTQQLQWIVDNEEALNIKFVLHVGDAVDTNYALGTPEEVAYEWSLVDTAMEVLDGEIPYIIIPGNHDYENLDWNDPPPAKTADSRDLTYYDEYFPVSRFDSNDGYGGHFPADSNRNSYAFFTVDDQEWLVMGLEYLPTDEVLSWASGILDDNLDKHVIIGTHQFTSAENTRYEDPTHLGAYFSFVTWNDPQDIWDVISQYDNIVLVVSGHDCVPDATGRMVDYVNGQPINQVMANYQAYPNGGNGWLRYYKLNPNDNAINAVTYSPYLSSYLTDSQNRFTLEFRKEGDGYGQLAKSVTKEGTFGTGTYSEVLTGLNPGTEHSFQAMAYNEEGGWGYGAVLEFTTLDADIPSCSTGSATSITSSSFVPQATLVSLGEYDPVYTGIEWGETTAYGNMTAEETMTATGGFDALISDLASDTTYHYRAYVRYNGDYVYGSDYTVTTLYIDLSPPTYFTVDRSEGEATLSWTPDPFGDRTLVRQSTSGYPSNTTSGVEVYLGTGSSVIDTGLTNTQRYYWSAWTEKDGYYSVEYATAYAPPSGTGAGILPVPDKIEIANVKIFSGYQMETDQLIVFDGKIDYNSGDPEQKVGDFFAIEVYDGGTLHSSTPVIYWGHMPYGVYFAPDNTLTWGQAFTIKIIGIPSQWDVVPECSYAVSSYEWSDPPTDLNALDIWVIDTARLINDDWLVYYPTLGYVLTEEATEIFANAIPALPALRFTYPPEEKREFEEAYQAELTMDAKMGPMMKAGFSRMGDFFGVDSPATMGMLFFAIFSVATAVGVGIYSKGNIGFALGLGMLPLWVGTYCGVILLRFPLLIAFAALVFMIKDMWLHRT